MTTSMSGRPPAPDWWRRSLLAVAFATAGAGGWLVLGSMGIIGWFWPLMVGTFVVPALGICWLVLVVTGLVRYRAPTAAIPAVIVALIAGGLLATDLPSRAQYRLSAGALNRAADECPENTDGAWVGLVRMESIERAHGHCFLYLSGSFLDRHGLVRMSEPPPADARITWGMTFTPAGGDWYRFIWHF